MKSGADENWIKLNELLNDIRLRFSEQKSNAWNNCYNRYKEITERKEQFAESIKIIHKYEIENLKSTMTDSLRFYRNQVDKDREQFRSQIQKQKAKLFFRAIQAQKEKEEMQRLIDKNQRIIAMKKRCITKIQTNIITEKQNIERMKADYEKSNNKMMTTIAQMNASVNKWSEHIETDVSLNINKVTMNWTRCNQL